MSYISVPNTFAFQEKTSSAKMNQNFAAIVAGLSDGSKDLNVNNCSAVSVSGVTGVIGGLTVNNITFTAPVPVKSQLSGIGKPHYSIKKPVVLNLETTDADFVGFSGGFSDGRYGYCVPNVNKKVARFDLVDYSTVATLDLGAIDAALTGFEGGCCDGRYGYLCPGVGKYKVVRIDLVYFSTVVVLDLSATDATLKGFSGCFIDGAYLYLVPYDNGSVFGKIVRILLSDFATVSVLDLSLTNTNLRGFKQGFANGGYGYCVPYFYSYLARFKLSDFATVEYIDLAIVDRELFGFQGGVSDGRYVYLIPYQNDVTIPFGKIARVDCLNFTVTGVIRTEEIGGSTTKGFAGGFTDGRYGYFCPRHVLGAGAVGALLRLDLNDFSTYTNFILSGIDADLCSFWGAFTDGRFGYLVPNLVAGTTYTGKVVRFLLQ